MFPFKLFLFINFVLGIIVGDKMSLFPFIKVHCFFFLLMPLFFLKDKKILFAAIFFFAGTFLTYFSLKVPENHIINHNLGNIRSVEGKIVSRPHSTHFSSHFLIGVRSFVDNKNGNKGKGGGIVYVNVPSSTYLKKGDVIRIEQLKLQETQPPLNPGGVDYKSYQRRKKVFVEGRSKKVYFIKSERGFIQNILIKARERSTNLIEKYFKYLPEERALLETISIGKDKVPLFLKEIGIRSGTYHLLVISGLHIGFIFLLLRVLFFSFHYVNYKHPKLLPLFSLFFLWFYAGIAGMKIPVVRATLMFSFFLLGEIFDRDVSGMDSVLIAAFLLLIINPLNLFSPGFQLSFGATFGILFFLKFVEGLSAKTFFLKDYAGISLGAQLFTIPLLLYNFGGFFPMGILNNLLIIPFVGITIINCLLFFILPCVFYFPLKFFAILIMKAISLLAKFSPEISFHFNFIGLLTYYSILFLVLEWKDIKPRKFFISAGIVLFSISFLLSAHPGKSSRMVFFSSEKILVGIQERKQCILFSPDYNRARSIENIFIPFAETEGISEVETLFFTGVSRDRIGALNEISEKLKIPKIYDLPYAEKSFSYPLYFLKYHGEKIKKIRDEEDNGIVEILFSGNSEKDGPLFLVRKNNMSVLIAPCLGLEGSERIKNKKAEVLVLGNLKNCKKVRENLKTVKFLYLILPKKLKKFAFIRSAETNTFYLKKGAVILNFSPKPFSISYFNNP